nr:MAG TPA: hypothetical protein [Caudoviricetes sp.]
MAQQDKRNFNEIKKENQEKQQQSAVEAYVKEVVNKNEEAKKEETVSNKDVVILSFEDTYVLNALNVVSKSIDWEFESGVVSHAIYLKCKYNSILSDIAKFGMSKEEFDSRIQDIADFAENEVNKIVKSTNSLV